MWIDDQIIDQGNKPFFSKIWVPESRFVVLGRSNDPSTEVNETYCEREEILILKRYGGGGTVVLYPGCVVVSLGMWVSHPFRNDFYFEQINRSIIDGLSQRWSSFSAMQQRGISDLAVGDYKVAGTSMFRSRHYLLYQASILCDLDLSLVNACLKHPSTEPEYRAGRSHSDFIRGLQSFESEADSMAVQRVLEDHLEYDLREKLSEELRSCDSKHLFHLIKKRN